MGECGADEGGVSREFFSGNADDSCQPITESFSGAKFKILNTYFEEHLRTTGSVL